MVAEPQRGEGDQDGGDEGGTTPARGEAQARDRDDPGDRGVATGEAVGRDLVGADELADRLLSGLETTMDQFNVDEWEPDLGGEAMARLYECLRKSKAKPTPDDLRRNSAVFARLCRLDPAAALKLDNTAAKK